MSSVVLDDGERVTLALWAAKRGRVLAFDVLDRGTRAGLTTDNILWGLLHHADVPSDQHSIY